MAGLVRLLQLPIIDKPQNDLLYCSLFLFLILLLLLLLLFQDINDFAAVNEIYKSFFTGGNEPARAAYQVAALPKGALVEIEAVAILGEILEAKL